MSALVIVQQRMGSTRLPGKARAMVGEHDVTFHVLQRAAKAVGSNKVCLAVPDCDDFTWADDHPGSLYRHPGDQSNLASRFQQCLSIYQESHHEKVDVVVRLTADCPFLPIGSILSVISEVTNGADYAETRSDPSTRPNGIDAQAFTPDLLNSLVPMQEGDLEHITPMLLRQADSPVEVRAIMDESQEIELDDLPHFRMTLDTYSDLVSLRSIYHLTRGNPSLSEVSQLFHEMPEVFFP